MTIHTRVMLTVIAQRAASSLDTLFATYEMTRSVIERQIPGDLVECGVFCGAQLAAMALACRDAGVSRTIRGFDSFKGVPAAGEHDKLWRQAWGNTEGVSLASACEVREYLKGWGIFETIELHVGLVDETIPMFLRLTKEPAISLLRVDCDLYEPTRYVLQQLEPLVSPGGWIIADDYGLDGARKAVDEHMVSQSVPIYWQKGRP